MRRFPILAIALLFTVAPAKLVAEVIDAGMPAPEWTMSDTAGKDITFPDDADGHPSILFFWASWCPYCHAVMPFLQGIVEDYAEHGVTVYAINFKDDADPVEYMSEKGYDFVVLPLGDLVADEYGVFSSPGILVVDGDGIVTYRRRVTRAPPGVAIAQVWDEQIREALDRALGPAGAMPR
jgi:cytochrome c biogenesis protein CcmG/thiol:disulfide interchange protein DsbE